MSEQIRAEILAPAGNFAMLKSVIAGGADAVYLGLGSLHARAKASDFSLENAADWLDYTHLMGVKVYVVLNVLLRDFELDDAVKTAIAAYERGVDALIIQDLSLATRLKRELPSLPLHASTQMGVHNLSGAVAAQKLGFDRVILSRETSLADIAAIKQGTDLEIEAFVHGAQCVSFSGNCYFSSLISGYSGNRGRCMQLCRKNYGFSTGFVGDSSCGDKTSDRGKNSGIEGEGYWLSPKDLCRLDLLQDMAAAGVTSFKIEGRLRRAEYAGEAAMVYKNALLSSGFSVKKSERRRDLDRLKRLYNRGDFGVGTRQFLGCSLPIKQQSNQPKNPPIYNESAITDFDLNNPQSKAAQNSRMAADNSTAHLVQNATAHLMQNSVKGDIYPLVQGHIGANAGKVLDVKNGKATLSQSFVRGDGLKFLRLGKEVGAALMQTDGSVTGFEGQLQKGDEVRITTDLRLNKSILEREKRLTLDISGQINGGEPIVLHAKVYSQTDFIQPALPFEFEFVSGMTADCAKNRPLEKQQIADNLGKLGDTVYEASKIDIGTSGAFMTFSQLNLLRRDLIFALDKARLSAYNCARQKSARRGKSLQELTKSWENPPQGTITQIENADQFTEQIASGSDYLCLSPRDYSKIDINRLKKTGKRLILNLPVVLSTCHFDLLRQAAEGFDALIANNLYALDLFSDYPLFLGTGLPIGGEFIGLPRILSPEVSAAGKCDFVYKAGRFPLMHVSHCVKHPAGIGCGDCENDCALTDEYGQKYDLRTVRAGDCCTQILGKTYYKKTGHGNIFIDLVGAENPEQLFLDAKNGDFSSSVYSPFKGLKA